VTATTERADLADWPDPELLVIAALSGVGALARTEVPADPYGTYSWLPLVRVQCFGGGDVDPATDLFRFTVDCFAATKTAARDIAGDVRQRLLNCPIVTDKGVLDRVTTSTRPNEVPYGDVTRVRRYTAAYSGQMRRR
jgi:hypothetical protein